MILGLQLCRSSSGEIIEVDWPESDSADAEKMDRRSEVTVDLLWQMDLLRVKRSGFYCTPDTLWCYG